jgi:hypothetical protein
MNYISHARNTEELKVEFLSDIRRRLAMIDGYIKAVSRSQAEKSRLACAENELKAMLEYWEKVEIVRPRRRPKEDTSVGVPLPHISSRN